MSESSSSLHPPIHEKKQQMSESSSSLHPPIHKKDEENFLPSQQEFLRMVQFDKIENKSQPASHNVELREIYQKYAYFLNSNFFNPPLEEQINQLKRRQIVISNQINDLTCLHEKVKVNNKKIESMASATNNFTKFMDDQYQSVRNKRKEQKKKKESDRFGNKTKTLQVHQMTFQKLEADEKKLIQIHQELKEELSYWESNKQQLNQEIQSIEKGNKEKKQRYREEWLEKKISQEEKLIKKLHKALK